MTDIIKKICSWLIKRGADKWLHFIVGFVIAQLLMLVPLPMVWCIAISLAVVAIADIIKETFIDTRFNAIDLLYTIAGGAVGVVLSVLTIIIK